MTKITNIGKAELIGMRSRIEAALEQLGQELGVTFKTGNGSYGGNTGMLKLDIKVDDPEIQTKARQEEFNQYCSWFDLEPRHFGVTFRANRGIEYKVVGLNLKGRSRKYPIIVQEVATGKEICFSDMAVAAIKAAA